MSTLTYQYSQLIRFSFLHQRIRRACAHAVSKETPTTIGHRADTQPATIGPIVYVYWGRQWQLMPLASLDGCATIYEGVLYE